MVLIDGVDDKPKASFSSYLRQGPVLRLVPGIDYRQPYRYLSLMLED